MTESFKQFRDRYPEATVLSEVLMVHGEKFVVKVTIETQVAGVASGLAADLNLEIAEDRARTRALVALGVTAEALHHLHQPMAAQNTGSGVADGNGWNVPESLPLAVPQGETREVAPDLPIPVQAGEAPHRAASTQKPGAAVKALGKPSPPSIKQQRDEPVTPGVTENSSHSLEVSPVLPAPVNLSDVIAQTDIELRRLQWTVDDGREYLERTYNKRSRHELTEEELIEFLCYLESLSESESSP